MSDLGALLDESELVIPWAEPVFRATSLYSALRKIYSKRGHDAELLEVWSKNAGSPPSRPRRPNPVSESKALV